MQGNSKDKDEELKAPRLSHNRRSIKCSTRIKSTAGNPKIKHC